MDATGAAGDTGAQITTPRDWRCILDHYYNDNSNSTDTGTGNRTAHAQGAAAYGQIAYNSDNFYVYTMNADGSGAKRLTTGLYPTWSPSSTQLAFTDTGGLFGINANGSGRYLITPQMGIYGPYYARWSKSGNNKVLFDSTYPDSLAHGYMVDAAGSSSCTEVIGLDKCPNGGGGGEFAPDGSRIVFNCSANAQDLETKTMNPDGSGIQPLNLSVPAEVPRWSPDHLRILLGGCGTTSTSYNGNSICLVNSDGTGFIQLTGSAPDVPQVDLNASWLDWQHIVFASNRDHLSVAPAHYVYEIYVMNSDGSGIIRLTNNSFSVQPYPDCSWCARFDQL